MDAAELDDPRNQTMLPCASRHSSIGIRGIAKTVSFRTDLPDHLDGCIQPASFLPLGGERRRIGRARDIGQDGFVTRRAMEDRFLEVPGYQDMMTLTALRGAPREALQNVSQDWREPRCPPSLARSSLVELGKV